MNPTLDYVVTGKPDAPIVTPGRPAVRVVVICVYLILWLLAAAGLGSLAGGWLGHTLFPNQPLGDDAPFAIGAVGSALLAGFLAWFARRAGWFHFLTIAVGALGFAVSTAVVIKVVNGQEWLWQAVALLFGGVAVAFAALVLAGVMGLILGLLKVRRS